MYKPMNKYSVADMLIRFPKPYNNIHIQILGFRSRIPDTLTPIPISSDR